MPVCMSWVANKCPALSGLVCLGFYGPLNLFRLYGAETEARRGDDPTLTSETRQGIFKVRLPKDS